MPTKAAARASLRTRGGTQEVGRSQLLAGIQTALADARRNQRVVAVLMVSAIAMDRLYLLTQEGIEQRWSAALECLPQVIRKADFFCRVGERQLCLVLPGLGSAAYPPMQEALDAMASDDDVTLHEETVDEWGEEENFFFALEPNKKNPSVGFIFYPGGLLDPRSYAPPMHTIAAQGYLTVIVKMPRDLAVFGHTRANQIIDRYPDIEDGL